MVRYGFEKAKILSKADSECSEIESCGQNEIDRF
jgi:hypothetical protein